MACPYCDGSGFIYTKDERGYEYARDCECRIRELMQRRIDKSGLSTVLDRYRMETFKAEEPWQKKIKDTAQRYLEAGKGWFYISGQPGCGKTHICTAISGEIINSGTMLKYVIWPDIVRQLKDWESNPADELERLKTAKALYIDDFFKFPPTEADLRLAFEILNARYTQGLRTIISSERDLDTVQKYDEAIASRIRHASKGFCMTLKREAGRDQRKK